MVLYGIGRKHPRTSLAIGILQFLILVLVIGGTYLPSYIEVTFVGPSYIQPSDTYIGVGLWRDGSSNEGEDDYSAYKCEDLPSMFANLPSAVGLDAETVLQQGLSKWHGKDLSSGDPLTFGSGAKPLDERYFRDKNRISEGSLEGGSKEGFGYHSRLSETKCGNGLLRRCGAGRAFAILASISALGGMIFAARDLDQAGAKSFRFGFAIAGLVTNLITVVLIVGIRETKFDLDNSLCGTGGEWSYGASFIFFCVATFLNAICAYIAKRTPEDDVPEGTMMRRSSRESLRRLSQSMMNAPVRKPSDVFMSPSFSVGNLSGRQGSGRGSPSTIEAPAIIYKPGISSKWSEGFNH